MRKYLVNHWSYVRTPGTLPGLDLLRALAVTGVLAFHFNLPFMRFGWIGVDLFFVLSGFLVGGAILRQFQEKLFSLSRFYSQRALRILPTYYFVVLLVTIIRPHADENNLFSLMSALTFTFMIIPFSGLGSIDLSFVPGGAWSLAIENWFYLFAPFILYFISKLERRWALLSLSALFLSGPVVRHLTSNSFEDGDSNWFFANAIQFHSRFDELVVGTLVFMFLKEVKLTKKTAQGLLALGIVGTGAFVVWLAQGEFWNQPQLMTWETIFFPSYLAASFALILAGCFGFKGKINQVTILARISYPLYLAHIFVGEVYSQFQAHLPESWKTIDTGYQTLILIAVSLACAYIISLLVEYPFMRLRLRKAGTVSATVR
jgi:peptidoglycan/LPS O-acetylase OafA/YrhL